LTSSSAPRTHAHPYLVNVLVRCFKRYNSLKGNTFPSIDLEVCMAFTIATDTVKGSGFMLSDTDLPEPRCGKLSTVIRVR
jgi:hypothetical protein